MKTIFAIPILLITFLLFSGCSRDPINFDSESMRWVRHREDKTVNYDIWPDGYPYRSPADLADKFGKDKLKELMSKDLDETIKNIINK